MTTQRGMKRCYDDDNDDDKIDFSPPLKSIKRLRDYQHQLFSHHRQRTSFDWSFDRRKKQEWTSEKQEKKEEQQFYDCHVYLKLYPSTLKSTLDVVILQSNEIINEENNSILLAKSRISKLIKPGVIRVRLVSSLFTADIDVHEDPSLVKLETIKNDRTKNNFDKQFALILKNTRLGPGVIGKLFVESLDPNNGSYSHEPPVFELNLILASEHEIVSTSSSHQKFDQCSPLDCGCVLSADRSRLTISDTCNLSLSNMKLIHRLAEPLRCQWKSIGRELSPCFSESDLIDFQRTYFISDGNHECAYQLLREWYIREPQQATIRHLLTRLKLPFDIIITIHNDVIKTFSSC